MGEYEKLEEACGTQLKKVVHANSHTQVPTSSETRIMGVAVQTAGCTDT